MQLITDKRSLYFPLRISLLFVIFTEVFLFVGPVVYQIENPILLVLFFIIVNVALLLGYKHEIRRYRPVYTQSSNDLFANKLIKRLIIIALLVKPITMYVGWQLDSFSAGAFVQKFITGLVSPKDVYEDFNNLTGGTFLSLCLVLISPITYMAMPLGIYNFRKLNGIYKALTVTLIILDIVYCLGLGIRKKLLDVIVIVFLATLAAKGDQELRLFKNKKTVLLAICGVFGLLYYFTYSSVSRNGVSDITDMFTKTNIKLWYIEHTSQEFYTILTNIHMYLCHGYQNFSVVLNHFFSSEHELIYTFGLGNNSFTLQMLDKYFNIDLNPYTYQYLLQTKYNIPIGLQWMSIYPWIANDVTILGVPFVFALFGKLFARFWLDSLYRTNIYAIPLLMAVAITIFYSFANNQALSYSFIPMVVIGFLYCQSKKHVVNE